MTETPAGQPQPFRTPRPIDAPALAESVRASAQTLEKLAKACAESREALEVLPRPARKAAKKGRLPALFLSLAEELDAYAAGKLAALELLSRWHKITAEVCAETAPLNLPPGTPWPASAYGSLAVSMARVLTEVAEALPVPKLEGSHE